MGKTPYQQVKSTTTAMLVTSMLVNDLNISDLWRLDVIRINNSAETKLTCKLSQKLIEFSRIHLAIEAEGRYEVQQPWKESNSSFPSNHQLALKRLNCY